MGLYRWQAGRGRQLFYRPCEPKSRDQSHGGTSNSPEYTNPKQGYTNPQAIIGNVFHFYAPKNGIYSTFLHLIR